MVCIEDVGGVNLAEVRYLQLKVRAACLPLQF